MTGFYLSCVYRGCINTKMNSKKRFFWFPSEPYYREQWIENCGSKNLKNVDMRQLVKLSICEDHFDKNKCFTSDFFPQLYFDAVPFKWNAKGNTTNQRNKYTNVCRTCSKKSNTLQSIFTNNIYDMLTSITTIQVIEGDGLPTYICIKCIQNLNNAINFKKQAERSEELLRQQISKNAQDPLSVTPSTSADLSIKIKEEKKVDGIDEDTGKSSDDESTAVKTIEMKYEINEEIEEIKEKIEEVKEEIEEVKEEIVGKIEEIDVKPDVEMIPIFQDTDKVSADESTVKIKEEIEEKKEEEVNVKSDVETIAECTENQSSTNPITVIDAVSLKKPEKCLPNITYNKCNRSTVLPYPETIEIPTKRKIPVQKYRWKKNIDFYQIKNLVNKQNQCSLCEATFVNTFMLEKHLSTQHNIQVNVSKNSPTTD